MTQNCLLYILVVIISVYQIYGASEQSCKDLSNTDCKTCLNETGCAFCKGKKICFLYRGENIINTECPYSDMQYQSCIGNFQGWIIAVSVIAGVLLLAILIVVCCIWRKCKRCAIRKEERRQRRAQGRADQQMAELRAAAESRNADRARVADQIRMKYGMLKEKENASDYKRMP